jgi:hypothetical protein
VLNRGASSFAGEIAFKSRTRDLEKAEADVVLVGRHQPSYARMIAMTVIWVLILLTAGPPQRYGTFDSFAHCAEAGQKNVERLRAYEPALRWECLPETEKR